MRKLRVIVCGVGFGRYYIEAILRLPDLFELVGILSRGSKNSIKLAEKYGVPLMTDIEEISKENVDAVCVVVKSSIVGGNGTDIVMQLLEKGIHVIQEQPIHSEEYKKCLIIAKKNHCKYQLNTFYPYLDSVRKFISIAIRLRKAMPITYIIAESSVQVLFPLLDILNQILGGVQPYKLEKLQGENVQRFSIFNWLIKKCPVTIWNSVPVLLDMLCICAETQKEKLPLRVVMLSGDWIGMDLPERVATLTDSCKFVAMGGATEASIWSNYQNVTLPLPMEWKSIPYGRPLEHQSYRVVDEYGRDCPYWAEGELWIGGYGIAKGYRGDSALTNQKFFSDSFGRWYKTGDLGRFWQDGTIEFLGRKDHQVKIRGHRIELGEIEHTIQRCEGVEQVVVDTFQDGYGKKSLVAYIGAPLKSEVECVTQITCKDIFCERWKKVKKSMADWTVDKEKEKAYQKFMTYGNTYCIQLMLDTWDDACDHPA